MILVDVERLGEPFEQCLACCPRKRPSQERFLYSWRLPNQHDAADHGTAANGTGDHVRAPVTGTQRGHMPVQTIFEGSHQWIFARGSKQCDDMRRNLRSYLRDLPGDA
jgi:hypothetical protein